MHCRLRSVLALSPKKCQQRSFWHARNPERFHKFFVFGFRDPLQQRQDRLLARRLQRKPFQALPVWTARRPKLALGLAEMIHSSSQLSSQFLPRWQYSRRKSGSRANKSVKSSKRICDRAALQKAAARIIPGHLACVALRCWRRRPCEAENILTSLP